MVGARVEMEGRGGEGREGVTALLRYGRRKEW